MLFFTFISMSNLWKGVELGGHGQPKSQVLEAHNSCTVRSEETRVKRERSQSLESEAKDFTVLVYCLSKHMIIHTHNVELK